MLDYKLMLALVRVCITINLSLTLTTSSFSTLQSTTSSQRQTSHRKWVKVNRKTSQTGIELSQNKQFTTKCDASGYHRRISIKNKRRSEPKTKDQRESQEKTQPNPFQRKTARPCRRGINPSPSQTHLKQREHLHLK